MPIPTISPSRGSARLRRNDARIRWYITNNMHVDAMGAMELVIIIHMEKIYAGKNPVVSVLLVVDGFGG